MNKIFYNIAAVIFLVILTSCAGYEPIFSTSKIGFKIADYSISGDNKIGNQLYVKLNDISKSSQNNSSARKIYILIKASKNKKPTAKNNAGKILGYNISITSKIIIKDLATGKEIINKNLSFSSTYAVQDQFSETLKLENRVQENLIDKIYQDLLIEIAENI